MSFHPRTPQSPSHFSPSTSFDPVAAISSTAPPTGTTALPTPAHSVNGSSAQSDTVMVDDSPNKRKRSPDDAGDRAQKKVHLEGSRLGIEDLHLDVGVKYLLCQTQHPEPLPRLTEDLYETFGLAGLAAEVAREKPNGEKNALRKTYKGHIKRLGVAGHFDVQKKKEDAPSEFLAMVHAPDLVWSVHQIKGRDIADGLSKTTLSSLDRALTMAKGPLPKSIFDSSVLGDLAPHAAAAASRSIQAKQSAPNTPLATTPNAAAPRPKTGNTLAPGSDPNRPRRNIKKRTYGDSSYEGYGEGFPDEDGGLDTGYSTGEGESAKKRRKPNPSETIMRQQSYGPGMVGA